ncbi:hypothetical protein ACFLS1_00445 [Verrucomicrobiota bacterium]
MINDERRMMNDEFKMEDRVMKTYDKNRNGAALLTVLMVIMTVTILLGTVISAGIQRTFTTKKLTKRLKATAYAEAGVDEAYSILSTNFAARTNAAMFPAKSYGDGSYDATVIPISNDMALIICTGICEEAVAAVMVDVKNYGGSTPGFSVPTWDTNILDIAILCGGDFDLNGSGDVTGSTGATIHVNGEIDLHNKDITVGNLQSSVSIDGGPQADVTGNATAPDIDVDVSGTETEQAVDNIAIPEIDLTPYYNEALANSEVIDGDVHWAGDNLNPAGGIIWVNGNVDISSDTVINGTVIATGYIHISANNGSKFSETNGYPLFVSRDSYIRNQCSGDIDGFIYVPNGDYIHSANGTVDGMIVVGGDIDKTGNSDIMTYEFCWPTPPGGDSGPGSGEDVIGISAWQQ